MSIHHICQSVDGALANYTARDWKHLAKNNNCSVLAVKKWFKKQQEEGKRVIPFGEKCEGFNYETGCPGHEEEINYEI